MTNNCRRGLALPQPPTLVGALFFRDGGRVLMMLLLLLATGPVRAEEVGDEREAAARAAFETGRVAYDRGAFSDALRSFERAHAQSPKSELLYNIGRAADSDGNHARAISAYSAYLEAFPTSDKREFVQARLEKVQERLRAEKSPRQKPALVREKSGPRAVLDRACAQGDLPRCMDLAAQNRDGNGVAKNVAEAVRLYTRACDGGNIHGCAYLGAMYSGRFGNPKNSANAERFFAMACQGGVAGACNDLGWMYVNGDGVPKQVGRGAELYDRACGGGDMTGCTNLAVMYAEGAGVVKDEVRANELHKKACVGGHQRSCLALESSAPPGR